MTRLVHIFLVLGFIVIAVKCDYKVDSKSKGFHVASSFRSNLHPSEHLKLDELDEFL